MARETVLSEIMIATKMSRKTAEKLLSLGKAGSHSLTALTHYGIVHRLKGIEAPLPTHRRELVAKIGVVTGCSISTEDEGLSDEEL